MTNGWLLDNRPKTIKQASDDHQRTLQQRFDGTQLSNDRPLEHNEKKKKDLKVLKLVRKFHPFFNVLAQDPSVIQQSTDVTELLTVN